MAALTGIPIYSVGPATTRALKAVPQQPPLQIFGEHTGNGDSLAQFILGHYGEWYKDRQTRPPLLFVVGEKRRDAIPKTLMDDGLPGEKRIQVDETVVYGTSVRAFGEDFRQALSAAEDHPARWVVVFSPSGCDSMLADLGLLDKETGRAGPLEAGRRTFVATIGPTTRSYLMKKFDFEPDVCAEEPSPEGIRSGITRFMVDHKQTP